MNSLLEKPELAAPTEKRARMETRAALLLRNWAYAEMSVLRVIAGWGRAACRWEDKMAVCYHVWLQAEIVDNMRQRLAMFPGESRKGTDAPVSQVFETAMNTVLLAPTFREAMAGVHELVNPALVAAYQEYLASSHPIHDLPTHDLLREVLVSKAKQAAWYQEFQACEAPIDSGYERQVCEALATVGNFSTPILPNAPFAEPCGKNSDFLMAQTPGRLPAWEKAPNIMPLLTLEWSHSVEARRLFFIIGYLQEMGVAEEQLRWIYYADFMPWAFIHAEARHMWDESRHGDSGRSRLADFGLGIEDVGYNSYGAAGEGTLAPMSPREVYDGFYRVTQVAETGYFKTKGYSFEDFRDGGDAQSAEMMQFDIIDETSHTEYGRLWLEEMMSRAGVDEDYRARGLKDRQTAQQNSDASVARMRAARERADPNDPLYQQLTDEKTVAHYHKLIGILREQQPLSNAESAPIRPNLPM